MLKTNTASQNAVELVREYLANSETSAHDLVQSLFIPRRPESVEELCRKAVANGEFAVYIDDARAELESVLNKESVERMKQLDDNAAWSLYVYVMGHTLHAIYDKERCYRLTASRTGDTVDLEEEMWSEEPITDSYGFSAYMQNKGYGFYDIEEIETAEAEDEFFEG